MGNEGGYICEGVGVVGKYLYLLLNFAINIKLLLTKCIPKNIVKNDIEKLELCALLGGI